MVLKLQTAAKKMGQGQNLPGWLSFSTWLGAPAPHSGSFGNTLLNRHLHPLF